MSNILDIIIGPFSFKNWLQHLKDSNSVIQELMQVIPDMHILYGCSENPEIKIKDDLKYFLNQTGGSKKNLQKGGMKANILLLFLIMFFMGVIQAYTDEQLKRRSEIRGEIETINTEIMTKQAHINRAGWFFGIFGTASESEKTDVNSAINDLISKETGLNAEYNLITDAANVSVEADKIANKQAETNVETNKISNEKGRLENEQLAASIELTQKMTEEMFKNNESQSFWLKIFGAISGISILYFTFMLGANYENKKIFRYLSNQGYFGEQGRQELSGQPYQQGQQGQQNQRRLQGQQDQQGPLRLGNGYGGKKQKKTRKTRKRTKKYRK